MMHCGAYQSSDWYGTNERAPVGCHPPGPTHRLSIWGDHTMHDQGKPGLVALEAPTEKRRTYSVAEVAEMFGVHPATMYREIKAGRLKAIRIGAKGGVVRVPVWAVAEYENASAVAA